MSVEDSAVEEYACEMVAGLDLFLSYVDESAVVLETDDVEGEGVSVLVFGLKGESVPNSIVVDEWESFTDSGFVFEFGLQGDGEYFVVRTDVESLSGIDMDEHIGEGVSFLVASVE